MGWTPERGSTGRPTGVTTADELVRHLQEAGATRVYLVRTDAFRDGTIPITATYKLTPEDSRRNAGSRAVHEMLTSVFESIGDRLWVQDREWVLDWEVKPAFTEPPADLLPLYDRGVEQKHGDGFNLRNLLFAYEAYLERPTDS